MTRPSGGTSDGTAVAGTDYQAADGTLIWDDDEGGEKTFTVQIFENGAEENNRTVNLALSNETGGAVLGLSEATLMILDDESLVCNPNPTTLCLNEGGRFRAEIVWRNSQGETGTGQTVDIGKRDSGLFFFFNEDSIEMLLKVFYAATTNVELTLTVTDTQTGAVKQYSNHLGNAAAPILDTFTFSTCP